jgi:hypothetical protein
VKTIVFNLLIFICCISFFSNCNKTKCNQQEISHLTFTEGDRTIIPYSGNETLIYKNTDGDSVIFSNCLNNVGLKKEYALTAYEAQDFNGCRGNYLTSEYINMGFNSQNNLGGLNIILTNKATYYNPASIKNIYIYFCPRFGSEVGFTADFQFSNDTLINYADKFDSIVAYYNSITLGSRTFNKVYELYSHNSIPPQEEWGEIGYYSIVEGMVGIRSNYNKIWYLDRKI